MGGLVQVLAALTVGTSCLVAADAKAMHHAFRVGWVSAVGLHTEAWPWALAAASGHELMKGHRSKRGVHVGPPVACQCVQFGEVHTEVCHMQELWRHRLGDLRCTGYHPSMAELTLGCPAGFWLCLFFQDFGFTRKKSQPRHPGTT